MLAAVALRLDPAVRDADRAVSHADAGRHRAAARRVRRAPLPHGRGVHHFRRSGRSPIVTITTLHGRLDLPDLQPVSTTPSPKCPVVSISEPASASRCRRPTAAATVLSRPAAETCWPSRRRPGPRRMAATSPSWAASRPEKRPDRRCCDRRRFGHALQDRRQGGPRRPARYFEHDHRADAGCARRGRDDRRDQRRAEGRLPVRLPRRC